MKLFVAETGKCRTFLDINFARRIAIWFGIRNNPPSPPIFASVPPHKTASVTHSYLRDRTKPNPETTRISPSRKQVLKIEVQELQEFVPAFLDSVLVETMLVGNVNETEATDFLNNVSFPLHPSPRPQQQQKCCRPTKVMPFSVTNNETLLKNKKTSSVPFSGFF